jgi:hypothetical protein
MKQKGQTTSLTILTLTALRNEELMVSDSKKANGSAPSMIFVEKCCSAAREKPRSEEQASRPALIFSRLRASLRPSVHLPSISVS